MRKLFFTLLIASFSSAFAEGKKDVDPCAQFASYFALSATTTDILLNGVGGVEGALYDHNYYPDTPALESEEENADGEYVKTFSSVITVVSKSDNSIATRYNVTLKVTDRDASCPMVIGSETVELEN